jgi:hypothetical protein
MKTKMILMTIALAVSATPVVAGDNDTRQLVEFPPNMRQHMLSNMRDHLQAVSEIQLALSSANFDKAADIAETRLGMSSLASHGASHMATFMPQQMQSIGTEMHHSASQFAIIAQESAVNGDIKKALSGLAKITQNCVACHAAFRVH